MELNEALNLFEDKGVDAILALSNDELDKIQSELLLEYRKRVDNFPTVVDNVCEAVKNLMEIADPTLRLLNESKKLNNN